MRNRASAKIVTVAAAARYHHGVGVTDRFLLVPYIVGLLTKHVAEDVDAVLAETAAAVGAGEGSESERAVVETMFQKLTGRAHAAIYAAECLHFKPKRLLSQVRRQ